MEWEIEEYQPRERGQDWYWAIGVITLALTIAAFIFSSTMLALFILVAGGTLILFAMRDPDIINVQITDRGVRVDDKLYPFPVFDSFWVDDENEDPAVLILKTEQVYSPLIIIPIASDIDNDILRDNLLEYLDEEEMNVPLSQKILEFIGL